MRTDHTSRNRFDRMNLPFVGLATFARRFEVVGADFVEASPPCDPSGITSLLAARTGLDFIGSAFHERARRRAPDTEHNATNARHQKSIKDT
jgi:hypothetical protein